MHILQLYTLISTLYTSGSGSLANSEDPDEISSGSTQFVMTKTIFNKRNIFNVEIITSDPSVCRIDHPKCIVSKQKEESIGS